MSCGMIVGHIMSCIGGGLYHMNNPGQNHKFTHAVQTFTLHLTDEEFVNTMRTLWPQWATLFCLCLFCVQALPPKSLKPRIPLNGRKKEKQDESGTRLDESCG